MLFLSLGTIHNFSHQEVLPGEHSADCGVCKIYGTASGFNISPAILVETQAAVASLCSINPSAPIIGVFTIVLASRASRAPPAASL